MITRSLALLLIVSVGCSGVHEPPGELLEEEVLEFRIVRFNRPKHYEVWLHEIGGREIKHQKHYVSKHFNEYRKVPIRVRLTRQTWRKPNGTVIYRFPHIYSELKAQARR